MLGLSVGLTTEEMAMMHAPDQCGSFDETDRLVLRYSEVLTRENRMDDALFAALKAKFSDAEIMELALTVGLSAMVNRVHATGGTDVDANTRAAIGDAVACVLPGR